MRVVQNDIQRGKLGMYPRKFWDRYVLGFKSFTKIPDFLWTKYIRGYRGMVDRVQQVVIDEECYTSLEAARDALYRFRKTFGIENDRLPRTVNVYPVRPFQAYQVIEDPAEQIKGKLTHEEAVNYFLTRELPERLGFGARKN